MERNVCAFPGRATRRPVGPPAHLFWWFGLHIYVEEQKTSPRAPRDVDAILATHAEPMRSPCGAHAGRTGAHGKWRSGEVAVGGAGGKQRAHEILSKMARKTPYYNKNKTAICSFWLRNACTRADCPYRPCNGDTNMPELQSSAEMRTQNLKDRYYGKGLSHSPHSASAIAHTRPAKGLLPLPILVPQGTVIAPDCLRNTNPGYTRGPRDVNHFSSTITERATCSRAGGISAAWPVYGNAPPTCS